MRPTPIEERVSLASVTPGGTFTPNGVQAFTARFSTTESLNEFMRWRRHPVTLAYLAALRALAVSLPPGYLDRENLQVQYGVQCGVSLCATMADDPTALFPKMFTGSTSGPDSTDDGQLASDYTDAPDALAG